MNKKPVVLIGALRRMVGKDYTLKSLCAAAFIISFGLGLWLVAIPFIIKRMGGSDTQVGACLALYFLAYVAACLFAGGFLDSFNAKRTAQWGLIGTLLTYVGMYLIAVYAEKISNPILLMNIFSFVNGAVTTLVWPPMMGWVSIGCEGPKLNRRFGLYNSSWSAGSWVSPYVGGVLVSISSDAPLLATFAVIFTALAILRVARNPHRHSLSPQYDRQQFEEVAVSPLVPIFKIMARIAMPLSYICFGLARSQLGLLFKFELGFSETNYGLAMMFMCLTVFVVFWLLGRFHSWHFQPVLLWGIQFINIVSMLIIVFSKNLAFMCLAAIFIGGAEAYLYSSHLFYGVSGAKKRSGAMAIHELLASLGLAGGSFIGGYISDIFGRYGPYWWAIGVVVISIAAQIFIYTWYKNSLRTSGEKIPAAV